MQYQNTNSHHRLLLPPNTIPTDINPYYSGNLYCPYHSTDQNEIISDLGNPSYLSKALPSPALSSHRIQQQHQVQQINVQNLDPGAQLGELQTNVSDSQLQSLMNDPKFQEILDDVKRLPCNFNIND